MNLGGEEVPAGVAFSLQWAYTNYMTDGDLEEYLNDGRALSARVMT